MADSVVLPEYRGRGLYKRMLDLTMNKLIEMGFQKIWSKHNVLNNAVIIPKLEKGFQFTGTELNEFAGCLIHLSFFTIALRVSK